MSSVQLASDTSVEFMSSPLLVRVDATPRSSMILHAASNSLGMRLRNLCSGGLSTYIYPHSIESGAGERITFVRRVLDPTGDRLEVENVVKPGSGPPMHVHNYQLPP
jgi:hypothetical protein